MYVKRNGLLFKRLKFVNNLGVKFYFVHCRANNNLMIWYFSTVADFLMAMTSLIFGTKMSTMDAWGVRKNWMQKGSSFLPRVTFRSE